MVHFYFELIICIYYKYKFMSLAQFHFQVIAEKSYFLVGLICREDCPFAYMLKVKFLINLFGKIMPSLKQIFLPFYFYFFLFFCVK